MKVMASTILVFRRMDCWIAVTQTAWGQPPSAVRRSKAPQFLGGLQNLSSSARLDSRGRLPHAVCAFPYSSLAKAASAVALPYSLSLLCKVFRLMARISAARVLLL